MICTVILRSSGVGMRQAMSTVTTDHFAGQAMCFMLSFDTGTCISFSHSSCFFKIRLADNCFVTIFHTLPFILRKCFSVFIANILTFETTVNHRAGILLISEDSSYCNIIPERLFLTVSGKLLFTSCLHGNIHSRCIYFILIQSFCNFIHRFPRQKLFENAFYNPACEFIHNQLMLVLWTFYIAVRRIGSYVFTAATLCIKCQ